MSKTAYKNLKSTSKDKAIGAEAIADALKSLTLASTLFAKFYV